ncbi:hypothetical protein Tco_1150230 [Tanacetum coccineum]
MAKAGHLCILKKEMAPLFQVVTSYSSPELIELTLFFKGPRNIVREVRLGSTRLRSHLPSDLLTLEGGKMPRMAVSMGITGLSKNLLQMHVREECLHPYSRSRNAGYLAARSALSSAFSMYETLDLTKHVNPGGTEGSSGAGKADPSASTSQDASSRSERPLEVSQEELWTSVDRSESVPKEPPKGLPSDGYTKVLDAMSHDFSRFTTWTVPYQRHRLRRRTGDASTSAALDAEDQPNP